MPDFSVFRPLTGLERTEFKRTVLKSTIRGLGERGGVVAELVAFFSAALPFLEADERAEAVAAVVAKGEYHPFRDGLHPSDVVKPAFVLDAKSVRTEFIYRSRSEAAYRQATAYRDTGFLPGLFIVYQGPKKNHRIVFMPGLLRRNASFTLNRVVFDAADWVWNPKTPKCIRIAQDGDDISAFLGDAANAEHAMMQMEAAMSTATKKFKNDPQMRKDLDEISADVLEAGFRTNYGKEYVAKKEQKVKEEIYHKLLGMMSEEEARRLTGYTGP